MLESESRLRNELEHAEFESVLNALSRSPRLCDFFRFLCGHYFSGNAAAPTEYDIATAVFGRSSSTFDASQDAIVRVEAHRLRKKLQEYYASEGSTHRLRISLPNGSYVPCFEEVAISAEPEPAPPQPAEPEAHESPVSRARLRLAWILLPVAALIALGFVWQARIRTHAVPVRAAAPAPTPMPDGPPQLPLRLLAGYDGPSIADSAGMRWDSDRYVKGGSAVSVNFPHALRTSDPFLFQHARTGQFFYDIPLPNGVYELHFYFITADPKTETLSTFTVSANSHQLLHGFDINSDALGENIADERVFRDIHPDTDGYLHIAFTGERAGATLSALEVYPGNPNRQRPIRITMRPGPVIDSKGQFWHPDTYFLNGQQSEQAALVTGTTDPDVFAFERFGHFTYSIPVDSRDRYTLILHFAEFYYGVKTPGGAGERLFRVLCNGSTLLDDFDLYKEAGSLHPLTRTFEHLQPSAQGKLNLTFEPILNNATISGIEVLDEAH